MDRVEFKLPAFHLKKELGRSSLPQERTDQVERMYLKLFNMETPMLEESTRMNEHACSKAQKAKAYHEATFNIKNNFKTSLRIMRGRVDRLVLALAINYSQREVVIEFGEKFIELFDVGLEKVSRLYGERILYENLDMRILKDTYGKHWLVMKEEEFWNAAEPTLHRTGSSIVFSEKLWNSLINCLQARVKPILGDMANICKVFNGILCDLKVKTRAVIKAKCSACQRPESGAQFTCARTPGHKIREIFSEIQSTKAIAGPGTLLNELWNKIDKMLPDIEKELKEEMLAEEHLVMKHHLDIPGFLCSYEALTDGKIPSEVEDLFNDM
jgi:hypothetical protein